MCMCMHVNVNVYMCIEKLLLLMLMLVERVAVLSNLRFYVFQWSFNIRRACFSWFASVIPLYREYILLHETDRFCVCLKESSEANLYETAATQK